MEGTNEPRRNVARRIDLRTLVVLPAVALTALAFARPAQADDQIAPPSPPPAAAIDRSVIVVVDEPDATEISDASAPSVEPVDTDASQDELIVPSDSSSSTESPANDGWSLWVAPERSRPSNPVPQTRRAVVSRPKPTRAVVRRQPVETPVRHAAVPDAEQYQAPGAQYQPGSDTARDSDAATPSLRASPAPQMSKSPSASKTFNTTNGVKDGVWNPAVNRVDGWHFQRWDARQKLIWKCRWISQCNFDIPLGEEPPPASGPEQDEESDPAECDDTGGSATQYQPPGPQYQPDPPADDSTNEDQVDPTDATTSEPCDEDDADETDESPVVPGPGEQPPGRDDSGDIAEPVQPAAEALPQVEPQGPTGVKPQPSAPQPDSASTGARTTPVIGRPDPGAMRSPTPHREGSVAAVGAAIHLESQGRPQVSPQPATLNVRRHRTQASVQGTTQTRAVPAPRVALPRRAAAPTAANDVPFGSGPWVLFFAIMIIAVVLLGLALAEPLVRSDWSLLGQIRSRVGSKGLSAPSSVVAGALARRSANRTSGIRYRE